MLKRCQSRAAIVTAAASFVLSVAAFADGARQVINIPAGDLDKALVALAKQSGVGVVYRPEQVQGIKTRGVSGELSVEEAVAKLLENTPLVYSTDSSGAVLVAAPVSRTSSAGKKVSEVYADPGAVRMARADRSAAESAASAAAQSSGEKTATGTPEHEGARLDEIVVTAQKRAERLIDTPQSVAVITAADIARLGATQLRDFASAIPGLALTTSGAGYSAVSLRGVTVGAADLSPTVGIYLDDVSYGSNNTYGQGVNVALDVGLFDIDRIEVLRGPQGTLYGASTMGGLIKYVTIRPDSSRFSGAAQVGVSGTEDGSIGYRAAGSLNVPLAADRLAIRASAFEFHDGGYVDNASLGRDDVNRSDVYGGRLDVLFTPTDALTLRLGAFLQNISRDGTGTADFTVAGVPELGELDQHRQVEEPFSQRFRLVSATAEYDFGGATLTSVSSYQTVRSDVGFDYTRIFVPLLAQAAFGSRTYGALGIDQFLETNKFTQELRLASDGTRKLEWLAGGYYSNEISGNTQFARPLDPARQPAPNDIYSIRFPTRNHEVAAFGDLTYHFTDRFDMSAGARHGRTEFAYERMGAGVLGGGAYSGLKNSKEDVTTYLANARYRFNPHATGYVRYATGFRPGGPNNVRLDPLTNQPLAPPTFDSDSLSSYEAGYSMESSGGLYSLTAAGYYIDWSDIQLTANRNGFNVTANAGAARIRGAELALTGRPAPGFMLTGAFAYQDARLADPAPDLRGRAGERLPNVPRFSGAVNLDYALAGLKLQPTLGATVRYIGERNASFDASVTSPQLRLPAYTTVDLRAAVEILSADVQLYVHNVANERGRISAIYFDLQQRVAIQQPRTVGLTVSKSF